jgi:hypothetical protein
VEEFHRLFEGNCDEQTDDDGRDVDEEVFPRMGAFARRVDVEHVWPFFFAQLMLQLSRRRARQTVDSYGSLMVFDFTHEQRSPWHARHMGESHAG